MNIALVVCSRWNARCSRSTTRCRSAQQEPAARCVRRTPTPTRPRRASARRARRCCRRSAAPPLHARHQQHVSSRRPARRPVFNGSSTGTAMTGMTFGAAASSPAATSSASASPRRRRCGTFGAARALAAERGVRRERRGHRARHAAHRRAQRAHRLLRGARQQGAGAGRRATRWPIRRSTSIRSKASSRSARSRRSIWRRRAPPSPTRRCR